MKIIELILGLFSLIFLLDIILYLKQPLSEIFYIIGDLMNIIFPLITIFSGFYAYKFHGFKNIQGKALFFLTLGMFFWFLGEFTWGIYEIILGVEAPIASIADLFWLIGYLPFLIGLYFIWKITSNPISNKRKFVVLLIMIIIICSISLYSIIPTVTDVEMPLEEKFSTAGYVLGDMIILAGSIGVIISFIGGKFTNVWVIILLGLVMDTIADIYYMVSIETYITGNLIDLLWHLGYLLIAFGFIYHRETVKNIIKTG